MSSNVSKVKITCNNTLNKEIQSFENELIKSQEKNDKKYVSNTSSHSLPSTIIIKGDNGKIQDNNSNCCIHELLSNDPILKTQVCNLM